MDWTFPSHSGHYQSFRWPENTDVLFISSATIGSCQSLQLSLPTQLRNVDCPHFPCPITCSWLCLHYNQSLMGGHHNMITNTQGLFSACVSHLWLFTVLLWWRNMPEQAIVMRTALAYISHLFYSWCNIMTYHSKQLDQEGQKKQDYWLRITICFYYTMFLTPRILGHIHPTILIFSYIEVDSCRMLYLFHRLLLW